MTSNRSTILFALLAALGLGSLIGYGLNQGQEQLTGPVAASKPAGTNQPARDTGGAPPFRYLPEAVMTELFDDFGSPLPVTSDENIVAGRGPLRTETRQIVLGPDQGRELKALMHQGDGLVYSWRSDGGQIYFDFHAHNPTGGEQFFTRYSEGEGSSDSGTIVAPYQGQHGWYWLNLEGRPQTIELQVSGFFDELIEVRL